MIEKLVDKNTSQEKGRQKQRSTTKSHLLSYLFLHKTERRPCRRNYGDKNITATLRLRLIMGCDPAPTPLQSYVINYYTQPDPSTY